MTRVVLLGAANPESGRMIAAIEAMQRSRQPLPDDYEFIAFVDQNPDIKEHCGLPVWPWEALANSIALGHAYVNSITGSTRARHETTQRVLDAGGQVLNFIHPSVDVSAAKLGTGIYIQEPNVIQAEVEIADNAAIHLGNLIAHEVKIGRSAFISAGCTIAGRVTIGEGAFIGVGATIIPDITVGPWATIGAGAVVIKDVQPYERVVGNPARHIGWNEPVRQLREMTDQQYAEAMLGIASAD